ncbi:hypothetical protein Tco_0683191 [Tanacetum coccineum]|uniref:Uncharacterized protein n=1 Tax=Tanacetum coccineum TaxID=301880 RepID=A0ABQ4XUV9_9ASTR
MVGEDENHDENANIPPPVPPTQQTPHTLSTIKLPILKKGEYDIWAMKIEHYLGHTDYPIWEVIQKGNGPVQVSTDTDGQIRVLPSKTAKEILARERERKARTTLLMSIPKDHLAKFHKMTDAKKIFSVSNSEGLHKGYDRFQSLLSQLEIHGVGVSTKDDLYKVFEPDVKGSTRSSSSAQNVAFVSSSTSSTNNVDEFDLEEMDLKWHVAMISMRLKKFYKKTERKLQFDAKELVGFDKTKEEPKALVTLDGDGVDWTGNEEDEQENFALMAYSNSCLDTEVTSCSKECEESHAKLKKLYDEQKEQLGDASIEIQAYTQALKKVEAQLMSAKDKSRLRYGDQIHEGVLSYENEVLESVFDNRSRIYMPPKSDFGIDESKFIYGLKQSKTSESDAKTSDFASYESNPSVETLESVPKPAVNEPKAVSKPKVWSDAPIIEEYESDSDDEYVIKPSKE